jgi:hypothetical protein
MCVVNLKSVNKLDLTWKQSFLIVFVCCNVCAFCVIFLSNKLDLFQTTCSIILRFCCIKRFCETVFEDKVSISHSLSPHRNSLNNVFIGHNLSYHLNSQCPLFVPENEGRDIWQNDIQQNNTQHNDTQQINSAE